MLKEFKEFAMRGNVLDMAVGVIIGAAFGKIVSSLVEDVIMPPIGKPARPCGFLELFINLSGKHYDSIEAAKKAGAATLNYGTLPEHDHQLSDRRLCCVSSRAHGESLDHKAGATRCADDKRLPAVRDDHSDRRPSAAATARRSSLKLRTSDAELGITLM